MFRINFKFLMPILLVFGIWPALAQKNDDSEIKDAQKVIQSLQGKPLTDKEASKLARAYISINRAQTALQLMDSLFQEESANLTLAKYYANTLLAAKKYSEAEALYREIIVKDRRSHVLHANLSLSLKYQGKYEGTKQQLDLALSLSPENYRLYNALGNLQELQGDTKAAFESYHQACRLNKLDAACLVSLGRLHDKSGRTEKAYELFERASRVDESYAPAWLEKARIFLRRGEKKAALREMKKAEDKAPHNQNVVIELISLLEEMGRNDEAFRRLEYARKKFSENFDILVLSGKLSLKAGDLYGARMDLEKAKTIRYQSYPLLTALTEVYLLQKNWDKAGKTIHMQMEYYPGDKKTRMQWAEYLVNTGKQDSALKILEDLLRENPEDYDAMVLLADVYQAQGSSSRARDYYQQVFKVQPSNVRAMEGLSDLLRESGEVNEVLAVFQRYLQEKPRDTRVLLEAANLAYQLNNNKPGLEYFERLLELEPGHPDKLRIRERINELRERLNLR